MTSNAISIENAVKDSKTTKNSKSSSRQCSDSAQIQGAGVGFDPTIVRFLPQTVMQLPRKKFGNSFKCE